MKLSHILVATDLSKEAMSCIPAVADLARSVGARITLLHVVESYAAIPHGAPLAPRLEQPVNPKAMEEARRHLEERRAHYGSDIQIDLELVPGGDPAKAIATYADTHGVDLVAVTTHGRTGLRRVAIGSVAEAVIRQSRVPVLVLPLPKD
jgi:nucleotide-binding universal stress UspA family protein